MPYLIVRLIVVIIGTCSVILAQESVKPVVVDRVTLAEINSGQRIVGTVNPLRTTTIGSAVDGRVDAFLVNQGDPVAKGQILAQLRTQTLEIELAAAEAELELYQQQLAQLVNGSRPEEIAEAEANMLRAKAAAKNAASKLQRIESLASSRTASASDLEDAREQAEATTFALQATEALLQQIREGPRQEAIAQAAARVELQMQRRNLLTDRIEKFTIRAPFDGFVANEFTEVGAWIAQSDPIVQVIQMNEVEIHAPVTAESAVNLRQGDTVRVEFPELPDELLTGTVARVVPVAESISRTFPVLVRLQNKIRAEGPMLLAGMLARVYLPAGKRETLPLVPKDALVLNGRDRFVFVVDVDSRANSNGLRTGKARKVDVSLGVAVDERIQVRGSLQVDDFVVVVGNERLIDDSPVQVVRDLDSTNKRLSASSQ